MIDNIANNKTNQELLHLNPPEKVKVKLDYYRTLFGKTHDLPVAEFEELKKDIATFFNLKPVGVPDKIPERLVRMSRPRKTLHIVSY